MRKLICHLLFVISCALASAVSAQELTHSAGDKPHETSTADAVPNQIAPFGTTVQEASPESGGDEGFARKRDAWFLQQRAYPNDRIPPGARWNALQQHDALRSAMASARLSGGAHPMSAFTSSAWTADGPQPMAFGSGYTPYSGRATSIAINPSTPTTMFLGTAAGGVWKTTDGGVTWAPMTDQQASLAIGALAIDPVTPTTIYAGTGEADGSVDSYYGQGMLKSTDSGVTWTLVRTPFTSGATAAAFSQIAIQPGNSSVVLASSGSGVYRSADAGATWTNVLRNVVNSVIFDGTNHNIVYAGVNGYYSGASALAPVYKSIDAGLTWTPILGSTANPLPAASKVVRTALVEDSTGANLYAAFAPSSFTGVGTLYKSTDGGANWTKLSSPSANDGLDWYRDGLAVVPGSNPNILYATGAALYQSLDGGMTWSRDTVGVQWADQHSFTVSPDGSKLYVADDGGIFVTSQPTSPNPSFLSLNSTLSTMTFYPGFSIIPGAPKSALAGSQDHGLDAYSGVALWTYGDNDHFCGDGGSAYVDPLNSHAYAHCIGGSANWIASASGGASPNAFVSAQAGINLTTDRLPWVADIKGDPENIAIVYTATNHLYQSLNYATTWTSISPDLTAGRAIVNTIAVSPTNSNVVYTGAGDGTVEVTTNALTGAASTWTVLTGLPNRSVSKIVVTPDSPQDVYVAVSGFGSGHIFRSTNGGTTWTDLSGNLPNSPVNSLLVDPDLIHTIYAATDTGVYYTADGGTTWAILGTGLPNVVVQDILMYQPTRTIRVITHGRGAWDISIPATGFVESTAALSFAAQAVGSTSAAQTVTLTNNFSGAAVPITGIGVSGNFGQTNTCGTSLGAGASCTVSVTFAPTSVAALSGTLTVASPTSNLTVNLSGIGLGIPQVTLSAATLTFVSQPAGFASPTQTIAITNGGSASLTGVAITVSGANGADFTQTNTCGTSLAIGANCSVFVTFTPSATGSRVGMLSVADNAANSPQTVSLSGTGAAPFGLTATQPAQTVVHGSVATFTLQLGAATATTLNAAVQVSCSGAPALATCAVSPTSVVPGVSSQTITMTVTTTAATTGANQGGPLESRSHTPLIGFAGLLGVGLLLRSRFKRLRRAVLLCAGFVVIAGIGGCSPKSNSPTGSPGTPPGTYALTVTAQSSLYQATQSLTLTVN